MSHTPALSSSPLLFGLGLLTLAALALLTGCVSTAPRPGTGDVAFRLRWDSQQADLDLAVQEPDGPWLSFMSRTSESGGFLDVDCNASPYEICKHPIENVFWPEGQAPEGHYRYRVRLFQFLPEPVEVVEGEEPLPPPEPPKAPVPFTVEVLEGERVVNRYRGQVSRENREVELEHWFARAPNSS